MSRIGQVFQARPFPRIFAVLACTSCWYLSLPRYRIYNVTHWRGRVARARAGRCLHLVSPIFIMSTFYYHLSSPCFLPPPANTLSLGASAFAIPLRHLLLPGLVCPGLLSLRICARARAVYLSCGTSALAFSRSLLYVSTRPSELSTPPHVFTLQSAQSTLHSKAHARVCPSAHTTVV
ncbi:hypothetical protein K438DRAFT_1833242 [Mycena galopus ATCC 62051]|nr:hypothetical protein K438DRAFT_1833242 [Mycena galopus ATCC 62051]